MNNEFCMQFTSLPANVPAARMAVATLAATMDFTVSDVEEIKVAVSEAVSNAVLHAYPDSCGYVWVRVYCNGNELVVEVEDKGRGIPDLKKAREPGFTTMPDHMGLGFSFMESFMDDLSLESVPGQGTRVRMVKRKCR